MDIILKIALILSMANSSQATAINQCMVIYDTVEATAIATPDEVRSVVNATEVFVPRLFERPNIIRLKYGEGCWFKIDTHQYVFDQNLPKTHFKSLFMHEYIHHLFKLRLATVITPALKSYIERRNIIFQKKSQYDRAREKNARDLGLEVLSTEFFKLIKIDKVQSFLLSAFEEVAADLGPVLESKNRTVITDIVARYFNRNESASATRYREFDEQLSNIFQSSKALKDWRDNISETMDVHSALYPARQLIGNQFLQKHHPELVFHVFVEAGLETLEIYFKKLNQTPQTFEHFLYESSLLVDFNRDLRNLMLEKIR